MLNKIDDKKLGNTFDVDISDIDLVNSNDEKKELHRKILFNIKNPIIRLKFFSKKDTEMNFDWCNFAGTDMENFMEKLNERCNKLPNLSKLKFANCLNLKTLNIENLSPNIKKVNIYFNESLESLKIQNNKNILETVIQNNSILFNLNIEKNNLLKKIALSGNWLSAEEEEFIVIQDNKNLEKIGSSGFNIVENMIIKNLPKLSEFKNNYKVENMVLENLEILDTSLGLVRFLNYNKDNLKSLSLKNIPYEDLSISGFEKLEKLDIVWLKNLNNLQLSDLPLLWELEISNCPQLVMLNLSNLNIDDNFLEANIVINWLYSLFVDRCKNLSEPNLTKSFTNLSFLSIIDTNINDNFFEKNKTLDLWYIYVKWNNVITNPNFNTYKNIRTIWLSFCQWLENIKLDKCKYLQNLNLFNSGLNLENKFFKLLSMFNANSIYWENYISTNFLQLNWDGENNIEILWDIVTYLDKNTIKIFDREIEINFPKHLNIFSWFVKTCQDNKISSWNYDNKYFDEIWLKYQNNIMSFIEKGKEQLYEKDQAEKKLIPKKNNYVFYIRAKNDQALTEKNNKAMKKYFKSLVWKDWKFYDYDINEKVEFWFDKITTQINEINKLDPKPQIIIHMAWHWWIHWDILLDEKNVFETNDDLIITKEEINKIFNLWSNVHLNVSSCLSWHKDTDSQIIDGKIFSYPNRTNNELGSISFDSFMENSLWWNSKFSSDFVFNEAFEKKYMSTNESWDPTRKYEADYDWDGFVSYHEALIYRMFNYNHSTTPILFDSNGDGILDTRLADENDSDIWKLYVA